MRFSPGYGVLIALGIALSGCVAAGAPAPAQTGFATERSEGDKDMKIADQRYSSGEHGQATLACRSATDAVSHYTAAAVAAGAMKAGADWALLSSADKAAVEAKAHVMLSRPHQLKDEACRS